jgi:carbamoyltransferase
MSRVFGELGPAHPRLGRWAFKATRPLMTRFFAGRRFYAPDSAYARERVGSMQEKLKRGEPVYLMGIGPAGHNSGVSLIEATAAHGVRLICNDEEERYTGIKHYSGYPEQSIESLRTRLTDLGIGPRDIHACLASWNYIDFVPAGVRAFVESLPYSLPLLHPDSSPKFNGTHVLQAAKVPKRLGRQLDLGGPMPIIAMRHHDNHAYFSYGVSPFNHSTDPVMVTVLDGYGDSGSISLYVAHDNRLRCIRDNESPVDSLGALYGVISSTQGGWTTLSSEGRYMGATAWGNNSRLTNPYYRQLRQLFYFGGAGQVYANRRMMNWHNAGERRPYNDALTEVLGPPIPQKDMWNPDAVLRVEDIQHSPNTQERLDKAAATQLLFEDAVFHIVDYLIRTTRSDKLVMTGGTALNCIANMRLLEHFDEAYYERYLGMKARLHLWVPPTPGDAGVAMGAAYNFALSNGVRPGEPLRHAFYCGTPPDTASIRQALENTDEIASIPLGNIRRAAERQQVADWVAYVVAHDGILGLFHDTAETGPRALGHRSILANPCNPDTLANINRLVKFRERIRPLAPMATYEAARHCFELSPGAADDDYNAYGYMVLTVPVRPESATLIPAVVHHDGTARVQIVREDIDPFTHAYLKAMGRRVGVEVSVNTSLNVGSPIVQTPAQALQVLKRSKGLSGLILIGADGEVFVAWHNVVSPPKDGGQSLKAWYREWQIETAGEVVGAGGGVRPL